MFMILMVLKFLKSLISRTHLLGKSYAPYWDKFHHPFYAIMLDFDKGLFELKSTHHIFTDLDLLFWLFFILQLSQHFL